VNADRRKALIACTAVRVILRGMPLDEALAAALEKAGSQVSEIERAGLRRDAENAIAGHRPERKGVRTG